MKYRLLVALVALVALGGLGYAVAAAGQPSHSAAVTSDEGQRANPALSHSNSFYGVVANVDTKTNRLCVRRLSNARAQCGFAFVPNGTRAVVGAKGHFTVASEQVNSTETRRVVLVDYFVGHG